MIRSFSQTLKPHSSDAIAFGLSLCIHLSAAIVLAMVVFVSSKGGSEITHVLLSQESLALPEVSATVFEAKSDLEQADNPIETPTPIVVDSIEMNAESPRLESPLLDYSGAIQTELANRVRLASSSSGAEAISEKPKKTGGAKFFGAEAYGNRFVFVIDSSGSMRGPRWRALCQELIRAIQALSEDQEFFVLSFDSIAHPMFGEPPPQGQFLHPSPSNSKKISNWLSSIVLGDQTYPAGAVGIAMSLKPDAIFLLSDGEISDGTIQQLRLWNHDSDELGVDRVIVPIHTVLLHSQIGFNALQLIAEENAGTFTPVAP